MCVSRLPIHSISKQLFCAFIVAEIRIFPRRCVSSQSPSPFLVSTTRTPRTNKEYAFKLINVQGHKAAGVGMERNKDVEATGAARLNSVGKETESSLLPRQYRYIALGITRASGAACSGGTDKKEKQRETRAWGEKRDCQIDTRSILFSLSASRESCEIGGARKFPGTFLRSTSGPSCWRHRRLNPADLFLFSSVFAPRLGRSGMVELWCQR